MKNLKMVISMSVSLAAVFLLAAGVSFAGSKSSAQNLKEIKSDVSEKNAGESDYAGVYKLSDAKICNIVITIKKDKSGYTYKIAGSGAGSSGKLSITKGDAEIYLVFARTKRGGDKTAIEGAYSDGKITIQNYGNSMNQYVCFKKCDAKYLEFIKEEEVAASGTGILSEDNRSSAKSVPDDIQNLIISKISELPEYKNIQKSIGSSADKKSRPAFIIERSENEKNYSVQIGYNGAERFETYFFFSVEPVTYKIMILDIQSNEYVAMDVWRKRELKRTNK